LNTSGAAEGAFRPKFLVSQPGRAKSGRLPALEITILFRCELQWGQCIFGQHSSTVPVRAPKPEKVQDHEFSRMNTNADGGRDWQC